MPHSTVLFDLDGVLRTWPTDYSALEGTYGLPAGSILRVAFESGLVEQVVKGRITDHDWRSQIATRLAMASPASRAKEAIETWSKPVGEVNREVLDIIIQMRKTCRIGLVTNATDRLAQDLEALGLLKHLDFIINSSEVGFAKPSSEIFVHALAAAEASPEETAFIDDTLSNIGAASAMGFTVHHYTGAAGLRTFIRSIGLLADSTS